MLPDILEEGRRIGHDVDRDPLLALDPSNLLRRYLVAEDWQVDKAAQRLRSTIAWRRDWRVMEYYRPGCGNYLYDEISNPGSEMYFADSMHVDRQGRPYMVGRVNLCNGERMHPWRHLRAGIYALDRFALKIIQNGCGYGSYLLDIGRVAEQGKFSGTGGGANFHPQESKNPYYLEGAGKDASSELLERYGELNSGMSVLRAALRIAGEHYPELLSRVVFLRSDWLFSLAFKVFRLWAHKKTRDKFLFVGGRADPPMTQLLEWYRSEQLPQEFGGQGYCLDGDVFLRRAVDFLDTDAKRGWDLPDTWNTEISLSEFASTDAKDAGEAAKETSTTFSQIFNPFEACCCSNSEPSTPARRRTRSNMVRQPETGQARAAMSTRGPASLPQTSRFSSISINSRSFLFGVIVLIAAWATFDQLLTTPNGDTFRET